VLRRRPGADAAWATRALQENPGAFLCATLRASGATVTLRDGSVINCTASDGAELPFDAVAVASAIYECTIRRRFAGGVPNHLIVATGRLKTRIELDCERVDP